MEVLVAGVGNIFLGDDAFGVEVASRLARGPLPKGVEVGDFGIAGVHLAYQLLEGYRAVVLIDAVRRGGRPGDLYVIEPDLDDEAGEVAMDAHGMQPEAVLQLLRVMGGTVGRVLVVGCEPQRVEEGIGLSEAVSGSVEPAVAMVRELLEGLTGTEAGGQEMDGRRQQCYGR